MSLSSACPSKADITPSIKGLTSSGLTWPTQRWRLDVEKDGERVPEAGTLIDPGWLVNPPSPRESHCDYLLMSQPVLVRGQEQGSGRVNAERQGLVHSPAATAPDRPQDSEFDGGWASGSW